MRITLGELELHPVAISTTFSEGTLDLQPAEWTLKGPLTATGEATLSGMDIVLRLRLAGQVTAPCARCLEEVVFDLQLELQLVYQPDSEMGDAPEVEIHTADTEIGFFQGDGVDLEDVVREQVLLGAPMRALCREACQGICPQCGLNRNAGTCTCERAADARWEALARLRDLPQSGRS
ncbi:MAG: YceD family protein [Terriglobales bacterium]